jgi:hypothetical protein
LSAYVDDVVGIAVGVGVGNGVAIGKLSGSRVNVNDALTPIYVAVSVCVPTAVFAAPLASITHAPNGLAGPSTPAPSVCSIPGTPLLFHVICAACSAVGSCPLMYAAKYIP